MLCVCVNGVFHSSGWSRSYFLIDLLFVCCLTFLLCHVFLSLSSNFLSPFPFHKLISSHPFPFFDITFFTNFHHLYFPFFPILLTSYSSSLSSSPPSSFSLPPRRRPHQSQPSFPALITGFPPAAIFLILRSSILALSTILYFP